MIRQAVLSCSTLCLLQLTMLMGWTSVAQAQEPEAPAPAATPAATPEASPPTPEASATPEATASETESAAEPAAPLAVDTGNNAWMLTSSALVLFMTIPGLAMFYGGLVRKKNVLSILMQCIFLMGLMTVLWATIGYTLAFGGSPAAEGSKDSPFIGTMEYLFMENVKAKWVPAVMDGDKVVTPGYGDIPMFAPYPIPVLTHMVFQGMFFIITPALICGAFAERMKFSTMVVFSVLWGLLVYCPLCHWVWDGGILALNSPSSATYCAGGAIDFAGGTVVHISSGVSALICAIMLGKRKGYGTTPMPPHNLTYTVLGAGMLWVGWFGFNAGSELGADNIASSAFVVTHFCAAAACLSWPLCEWVMRGKPTALGAASGAVAGLVVITPAAGFVQPMEAIVMGLIGGVVCCLTSSVMKQKLGYDDSLDAFGVHGIGGTLGAILTGVFATRAISNMAGGEPLGLLEGGGILKGQFMATLITWVFAIIMTAIILKVLDLTMGLRVSEQDEADGLDFSQHGEEGYIMAE